MSDHYLLRSTLAINALGVAIRTDVRTPDEQDQLLELGRLVDRLDPTAERFVGWENAVIDSWKASPCRACSYPTDPGQDCCQDCEHEFAIDARREADANLREERAYEEACP